MNKNWWPLKNPQVAVVKVAVNAKDPTPSIGIRLSLLFTIIRISFSDSDYNSPLLSSATRHRCIGAQGIGVGSSARGSIYGQLLRRRRKFKCEQGAASGCVLPDSGVPVSAQLRGGARSPSPLTLLPFRQPIIYSCLGIQYTGFNCKN